MAADQMGIAAHLMDQMIKDNDHSKYTTLYHLLMRKKERNDLEYSKYEIKKKISVKQNRQISLDIVDRKRFTDIINKKVQTGKSKKSQQRNTSPISYENPKEEEIAITDLKERPSCKIRARKSCQKRSSQKEKTKLYKTGKDFFSINSYKIPTAYYTMYH